LKDLIESLRRIFVSPEFLVVALGLWVMYEEPQWLTGVSNALSTAPDGVKYLALVPVAIATWCIQQTKYILFPSEDSKGILQEWPKFRKLKERILIGLAYQVCFCALGISAWVVSVFVNKVARFFHATFFSAVPPDSWSRGGFSQTSLIGFQLRVSPDQRSGRACLAAS
jgi:hypothetical protein